MRPDRLTVEAVAWVLAWAEGTDVDEIDATAADFAFQDAAQQCIEDWQGLT